MNYYDGKFRLYDQKALYAHRRRFTLFFFGLISLITFLPSLQHANGENAWTGIDGNSGVIADMKELKVQIFSYLDEN